MSKTALLAILILLTHCVSGQNISMLDTASKWNIGYHCVDEGPIHPYDFWTTGSYLTEGDTVMNEKHFQKLFNCEDSLCVIRSFEAYVREESGQTFFANDTEELIQYDFNLQKGDTLILEFLWDIPKEEPLYIRIDSVNTIETHDQKTRRVQYVTVFSYYKRELGDYSINDVFVEGIGSLKFGIEYPRLFVTGSFGCFPEALLCFYTDGKLVYSNPDINNCYLSTEVQQLPQEPELVRVTANNGMLEIQFTKVKAGKLFVFDLQGKRIIGQSVNHSGTQFCLPSQGVYLYRFVSGKGEVQTGKVLLH